MQVIFDFVVQFCLGSLAIENIYKTDIACFITLGIINRCNECYKVLFIFVKYQNEKKSELFS